MVINIALHCSVIRDWLNVNPLRNECACISMWQQNLSNCCAHYLRCSNAVLQEPGGKTWALQVRISQKWMTDYTYSSVRPTRYRNQHINQVSLKSVVRTWWVCKKEDRNTIRWAFADKFRWCRYGKVSKLWTQLLTHFRQNVCSFSSCAVSKFR